MSCGASEAKAEWETVMRQGKACSATCPQRRRARTVACAVTRANAVVMARNGGQRICYFLDTPDAALRATSGV